MNSLNEARGYLNEAEGREGPDTKEQAALCAIAAALIALCEQLDALSEDRADGGKAISAFTYGPRD